MQSSFKEDENGELSEVRFGIPGDPMGKQRPKFSRVGQYVKTYTPGETVSYENMVKIIYQQAFGERRFGDNDMLIVRIQACFSPPKSVSKKKRELMLRDEIRPTKKPDFDNIGKIICDSLNKIAYRDDSQIVGAIVEKFYREFPGVAVLIRVLPKNKSGSYTVRE